ncbi:MAG TPA: hemerythrin domain-containing protein [Vicinamibacteria bacterium]|nr:hemerythrin domain-containing protein [Vicinamibacteria bacterium]
MKFDGVTSYLSWDHDRLDAILAEVCRRVEAGQLGEAEAGYREFLTGLRRHIRLEEELVFPLFEAKTGVTGGPTAVMRAEHLEIERALGMMQDGLSQKDANGFREGLQFLRSVLPDHNAKEEHVLYPTTDRVLSAEERSAFVERLVGE